jgi:hypothetical protein
MPISGYPTWALGRKTVLFSAYHFPVTGTASSAPGQGGIVVIRMQSGSSPVVHKQKHVPFRTIKDVHLIRRLTKLT